MESERPFIVPTEQQVLSDLEVILDESGRRIELEEGRWADVPRGAAHEIVLRVTYAYARADVGMGDHIRFLVALGGVSHVAHGVVTAGLGFATAWYSTLGKLITVDFQASMP